MEEERRGSPGATIRTLACNGEIQGFKYTYREPWVTTVRLSAADAAALVSFNGVMLAPRCWHCDLVGGSGGATLEAYNPQAGFFVSTSTTGTYQPQEAISDYFATLGNHALYQACPFFSLNALQLRQAGLGSCESSLSLGAQRTQVNLNEVDSSDPPGIFGGTGNSSGGRNRAIGIELFDVRYDNAGSAIQSQLPRPAHFLRPVATTAQPCSGTCAHSSEPRSRSASRQATIQLGDGQRRPLVRPLAQAHLNSVTSFVTS